MHANPLMRVLTMIGAVAALMVAVVLIVGLVFLLRSVRRRRGGRVIVGLVLALVAAGVLAALIATGTFPFRPAATRGESGPTADDGRQALAAEAAAAGAALAGKGQQARRHYADAARAAAGVGRRIEADALADTAELLGRMEPTPPGSALGILEAFGCEPAYVQRRPGRTSALYRHREGVIFVTATDVPDEAGGDPVVRPAGERFFVAWARTLPGGTYYLHGAVATRQAANEVAGWHAETARLPDPRGVVDASPAATVPAFSVHVPRDRPASPPSPHAGTSVKTYTFGPVTCRQAPRTFPVTVPGNFAKVEVGINGRNRYGGWRGRLSVNGKAAWRFLRFDKVGIIKDELLGKVVKEPTGKGSYLDVTPLCRPGLTRITYCHYTEGPGLKVIVRVHSRPGDSR